MININELRSEWDNNPPAVLVLSEPWPGAPYLPLTGGGSTDIDPDTFERELKDALSTQGECRFGSSHYRANVWEEDPDDIANQYVLKGWHRFDGAAPYQAVFILYYDAISRLKTLEKHMPDLVDEYLAEHPEEAFVG